MTATWHYPNGSLADGVTDRLPGWHHTSLRVAHVEPGGWVEHTTLGEEVVIVPLSGSYAAELAPADQPGAVVERFALAGRPSVFAGPTDVLYVPEGHRVRIEQTGDTGGQIALCGAYVDADLISERAGPSPTRIAAADVPIEVRGAGRATREVRNFGVPGVLDASRIIACEVITPSGNWSSWPPHKHDEDVPGHETALEEIYWFDVQADGSAVGAGDPVGYLRMRDRTSAPLGGAGVEALPLPGLDRARLDELVEVRPGDVVLVPYGWHGPAMAPPGYDLYYLNVMAGPGTSGNGRAWLITDDPAHAWVRQSWPNEDPDPRVPMGERDV